MPCQLFVHLSTMAPSKHLAATVGPAGSVIVKELDVPKPGPGEILVKVVAFAQNPTDCRSFSSRERRPHLTDLFREDSQVHQSRWRRHWH